MLSFGNQRERSLESVFIYYKIKDLQYFISNLIFKLLGFFTSSYNNYWIILYWLLITKSVILKSLDYWGIVPRVATYVFKMSTCQQKIMRHA